MSPHLEVGWLASNNTWIPASTIRHRSTTRKIATHTGGWQGYAGSKRSRSLLWNLRPPKTVSLIASNFGRIDMSSRILPRLAAPALFVLAAAFLSGNVFLRAQNSGMELHANDHATPAEIGLPSYPGATLYKDPNNDAAFDLGYSVGDSHFRLMAANYITSDSPDQVLSFYRKPLSHYGEVLECNDGKPVGNLTATRSGLTCDDDRKGKVQVNGYSDSKGRELRAGTPQQFRIVGIDKTETKSTRFGLVYVQLPKDNDSKAKSK
jgi:hypothetical protein